MTISDYKREIVSRNPCEDGLRALDRCRSRKAVFELLASPLGCDFFLQSVRDGWGPGTEDFLATFLPYVNGAHTVKIDTGGRIIRSQVWSKTGYIEVDDSVRWLILVGCRGRVKIRPFQVVKIFADADTDVQVEAPDNSIVYVKNYGGYVADVNKVCKFEK